MKKRSPRRLVVVEQSAHGAHQYLEWRKNKRGALTLHPKAGASARIVRDFLIKLRKIMRAEAALEQTNRAASLEHADREYWTRQILQAIGQIEPKLAQLGPDAHDVLATMVHLAVSYHNWTIADNEPAIDDRIQSIAGARRGGKARSSKNRSRNAEMAQEFQRRSSRSRKSRHALMEEIGRDRGLSRSAAVEAIKAGEKVLSGIRGKPDD
jgi:hypothetical protein